MNRPQPPRQADPVSWLRLRYAKRGSARFASHRDFARLFERALRRAEIPVAWSSGFTPHLRISYANPAPTGTESEAEYVDVALAQQRDPETTLNRLNQVLPEGFVILDAQERGEKSLGAVMTGSTWLLFVPSVDHDTLSSLVDSFSAADEVVVSRETPKGLRRIDLRHMIVSLSIQQENCLAVAVRHGQPSARPEDMISGIFRHDRKEFGPLGFRARRVEQMTL